MRTHGWGPAVVIPAVLGLAACGGGARGDGVASAGGAGAKTPAAAGSHRAEG
jgi:hypothetical protein